MTCSGDRCPSLLSDTLRCPQSCFPAFLDRSQHPPPKYYKRTWLVLPSGSKCFNLCFGVHTFRSPEILPFFPRVFVNPLAERFSLFSPFFFAFSSWAVSLGFIYSGPLVVLRFLRYVLRFLRSALYPYLYGAKMGGFPFIRANIC